MSLARSSLATVSIAIGVAVGAAGSASAQTTVRVQPLGDRTAIVIGNRASSQTTIVVQASGRMMAIHSLRRYRPGTRLRVRGIKWGSVVGGIKWYTAPRGIKWGIKWAMNGTYSSALDPRGTVGSARVRGIVISRSRTAVAIATRGGVVTVIIPMGLPAVTGSITAHALTAPRPGGVVTVPIRFDGGQLMARNITTIGRVTGIPVAGRVVAITPSTRMITIDATSDPILPVEITMVAPSTLDLTRLKVGDEVAAVGKLNVRGGLTVQQIGPNQSFAAANDPALQLRAPAPARPATLDQINGLVAQVNAAVTSRQITDAATATTLRTLSRAIRTAASDGNFPVAIASVDQFTAAVDAARTAGLVPPQTANRLNRLAGNIKTRLQDPALR